MTECLVNINGAARILGVSHWTIRDLIKNDPTFPWTRMNPLKENSPYRFRPSSLLAWSEGQRVERQREARKVHKALKIV